MHEFSRTELLIGQEKQKKLKDSVVAVFGVGGVGSHCIEALARSGVGSLILVDPDRVSLTNINRQSIAYHSTLDRYKTQVMRERILDIHPWAVVETREVFVLPENLEALMATLPAHIDYMADAVDTVSAKLAVAQYAAIRGIPLISSMGTGNKLHPELFEVADVFQTSVCPLCRVMRRELKRRNISELKVVYSKELPQKPVPDGEDPAGQRPVPASISFVPPAAGLLMAGEIIRDLAGIS